MVVDIVGATPLIREAVALFLEQRFRVKVEPLAAFVVAIDQPVPEGREGVSLHEHDPQDHFRVLERVFRKAVRERPAAYDQTEPLTPREHQVAKLIAEGLDHESIAERLGIRPQSVRNLTHIILRKLDCKNRVQVANRLNLTASEGDGRA